MGLLQPSTRTFDFSCKAVFPTNVCYCCELRNIRDAPPEQRIIDLFCAEFCVQYTYETTTRQKRKKAQSTARDMLPAQKRSRTPEMPKNLFAQTDHNAVVDCSGTAVRASVNQEHSPYSSRLASKRYIRDSNYYFVYKYICTRCQGIDYCGRYIRDSNYYVYIYIPGARV